MENINLTFTRLFGKLVLPTGMKFFTNFLG